MSKIDTATAEVRRACLELEVRHPGLRSLMFTGPVGREGTTTVACQYARQLADVRNASVVVVDGNLDHPGVHARMGVAIEPGLRDWSEAAPVRGLTALSGDGRVMVLPAGGANGITLYGMQASGRLGLLATYLQQAFSCVVWDAPPMNLFPDARLLLPHVDGVVGVVEADGTRLDAVTEFAGVVAQCGAPLLGTIMNRSYRYSFNAPPSRRTLRLAAS